jgi:protein-S-isoprenylcysteine O-methyltransferase Ste14
LSSPSVSAAEQTRSARFGAVLFRHRSFFPVLFLAIPVFWPRGDGFWAARMSAGAWTFGLILIVVGEWIRMTGVAAAGTVTRRRSRNVGRLVTYGAFAWSRNPLYNGNFLIWMGFVVVSGVFWFVPIAIAIFAVEYTFIVRYEEGVLESIFGDEYLAYKRATPRWIPRPPRTKVAGEHDWAEAWKSEISTFLQYVALIVVFVIKQKKF